MKFLALALGEDPERDLSPVSTVEVKNNIKDKFFLIFLLKSWAWHYD